MKAIFLAAVSAVSLSGCEYISYPTEPAGNPGDLPYAGQPGSVYDPAANPPRDIGQVSYNANGPLEKNLPAGAYIPPPAAQSDVTTAPLTPLPGQPAMGTRTR